jgi:hypothetical protein
LLGSRFQFQKISGVAEISRLAHELQRERGASAVFVGSAQSAPTQAQPPQKRGGQSGGVRPGTAAKFGSGWPQLQI